MTKRQATMTASMCLASALAGGVSATSITSSAASAPHQASQATSHYLRGGYVLTDGKCPKHTVPVNADVRGETNAPSGHSRFGLCFIK